MRKQSSMFLSICLGLALAGTSQAQPAPRILNVVPDGRELLIPLTAADIGRDIILVGESTAKNESQIEVSLGGAAGVLGQVLASTVSPSTQVAAMNLYSGWNIVKVRYQNSDFKTAILVGESTSSGGSADCFETMDPVTQVFVRQLYPGKSDAEICVILSGGYIPPPASTDELPLARGVLLRDACSSNSKVAVQLRISTAGQPASLFDGTKALRASLGVNKGDFFPNSKYLRIKPPEGMDRGRTSAILLSPAIKITFQNKYGAPGTDTMVFQTYSNGVATMTKNEKTRPLWGSKTYSISKAGKYIEKKKKLSVTVVNQDLAYNYCIPPGSKNRCTKKYSKLHGIRCSGL